MYIIQTTKGVLFLLLLCVLSQTVSASDRSEAPVFIHTILQQENTENTTSPLDAPAQTIRPQVHLHAMYGVGKQRVLELALNGQHYVFLPNQIWPLGDSMGATQLRFIAADQRCASFSYKDQPVQACIAPKGRAR